MKKSELKSLLKECIKEVISDINSLNDIPPTDPIFSDPKAKWYIDVLKRPEYRNNPKASKPYLYRLNLMRHSMQRPSQKSFLKKFHREDSDSFPLLSKSYPILSIGSGSVVGATNDVTEIYWAKRDGAYDLATRMTPEDDKVYQSYRAKHGNNDVPYTNESINESFQKQEEAKVKSIEGKTVKKI